MVATILVILFIAQMLSFYFIILLYTKISRLKDIEKSQERLKDEMYNAVGAYLAEMRDENDRLIKELTMMNRNRQIDENENKHTTTEKDNAGIHENQSAKKEEVIVPTYNLPRNVAAKAYKNNSTTTPTITMQNESFNEEMAHLVEAKKKLTLDEQIQELYHSGKTVDEIAKMLQKGKTEIELLLKFQH
ncbi:hypothetical protein ACIQ4I_06045 [Rummeliibacillus sp. NPDC094406]|uniref:hypothetical protein n=1 Tax=Rummeliibacillus sp. NPDC094406 TaxID=3364511 RepID=UPI003821B2C2